MQAFPGRAVRPASPAAAMFKPPLPGEDRRRPGRQQTRVS